MDLNLSRVIRKPTNWFRTGLTQTELYGQRRWLEAGNFGFRKKRHCTIHVVIGRVRNTMTGNNSKLDLVNVDAHKKIGQILSVCSQGIRWNQRLICAFVFAYAKCWFSHDTAQLLT